MPMIQCPLCVNHNRDLLPGDQRPYHDPRINILAYRGSTPELSSQVRLDGIVTCLDDNYEIPIRMANNMIETTGYQLVRESIYLGARVPSGLRQDVEEGANVKCCGNSFQPSS